MRIWESHGLGELRIERDEMEHKIRDVAVYETLLASFVSLSQNIYYSVRKKSNMDISHMSF
jgi:hypothetical protein